MVRMFTLFSAFCLILIPEIATASDLTREEAKRILGFMGCAEAQISVLTNGVAPAGLALATGQGVAFVGAVCGRNGRDVSEEHTFVYDSELGWTYYEKDGDTIRRWTVKGYQETIGPTKQKAMNLLKEFGLVGIWGQDCTKTNRVEFTTSPSPAEIAYPTKSLRNEPAYEWDIQSASLTSTSRLKTVSRLAIWRVTTGTPPPYWPATGETWEREFEKEGDKIKIVRAATTNGNKIMIKEDQALKPTFERCRE